MSEENISQEFRLKKKKEKINYLIKGITRNELMSKKHKKVCRVLNYTENSLVVISTIFGCVSIFSFAFWIGILIGVMDSAIGLKILQ